MLPMLDFDKTAIESVIKAAELRTCGEIRVYVERRQYDDVMERAKEVFKSIGMTNTKNRTGILFYVQKRQRKLVVLGDTGINEKVDASTWQNICDAVIACFQRKEMTVGIVLGIMLATEILARHFPCDGTIGNELADSIVVGEK